MAFLNDLNYLNFLSDGTVRTPKKGPAVSKVAGSRWIFDPDSIRLPVACGGYNCVVEISAARCLLIFHVDSRLGQGDLDLEPGQLKSVLSSGVIQSSVINSLNALLDPLSTGSLNLQYNPVDFQFIAANRMRIRYAVGIYLKPGKLPTFVTVNAAINYGGYLPSGPGSGTTVTALPRPSVDLSNIYVGSFQLEIESDFYHETDTKFGTVEVFAKLADAKLSTTINEGDEKVFYTELVKPNYRSPENLMRLIAKARIAPTYSVAGVNGEPVTELKYFSADVIPVGAAPMQALAIGVNLTPVCEGVKSEIQQFIGAEDYGVITDETTLNILIFNKWRLTKFPRYASFPASGSLVLNKNGTDYDAVLYGTISFRTLDIVAIEADANSGEDHIGLVGSATAIVNYADLSTGERIYAGNGVFGPPEIIGWHQSIRLSLTDDFSTDQNVKAYQEQAHKGAFQFIGKPFLRAWDDSFAKPNYCRVNAIEQQIFITGSFPQIWY